MPALGNALGLPFGNGGPRFKGALDVYASGLVALYSPFKRLLASYTGNGIRVRRSSDSALQWIGFNADGSFDSASYLSFIGAGNGFAHTVKDQLNGYDVTQTSAAAQPQIGVDGNGDYYLFAPGAGFSSAIMFIMGLSITCNEFTFWTVAGSHGYAFTSIMTRDDGLGQERQSINFSNATEGIIQDNATGTVASIGSTNTGVYSSVFAAGASGNKLTNRLATATGTRVTGARTINRIGIGYNSGGATWSQNSPWYMGGIWFVDKGPTADFAALATLGRTLIPAAQ